MWSLLSPFNTPVFLPFLSFLPFAALLPAFCYSSPSLLFDRTREERRKEERRENKEKREGMFAIRWVGCLARATSFTHPLPLIIIMMTRVRGCKPSPVEVTFCSLQTLPLFPLSFSPFSWQFYSAVHSQMFSFPSALFHLFSSCLSLLSFCSLILSLSFISFIVLHFSWLIVTTRIKNRWRLLTS